MRSRAALLCNIGLCGWLSVAAILIAFTAGPVHAALLLRESFDIPVGSLDEQAGATSTGFLAASVWDSGIYGAPDVAAGPISPPASVAGFYGASPEGNRHATPYGTVIGRPYDLSGTHFFGSFLTTTALDPTLSTDVLFAFQNFAFRVVNTGSGSFWRMDSFGFIDTGIDADGTTLVLWELEFNQVGTLDTFRIWFNRNPLTEAPDFEDATHNLGHNVLGGAGALTIQTNLYLGLSSVEVDELRIGTDWSSVGVSESEPLPALPAAGLAALLASLSAAGAARLRRGRPATARPR